MKRITLLSLPQSAGKSGSATRSNIFGSMLSAPILTRPSKTTGIGNLSEASAKSSFIYRTFPIKGMNAAGATHGVATHSGMDGSHRQHLPTEDKVKGLPGAGSVNNQLKYKKSPEKSPPDTMVVVKVGDNLARHRSVSALHPRVELREGIVTLKGEAKQLAQKDLTGGYVEDIAGVKGAKIVSGSLTFEVASSMKNSCIRGHLVGGIAIPPQLPFQGYCRLRGS